MAHVRHRNLVLPAVATLMILAIVAILAAPELNASAEHSGAEHSSAEQHGQSNNPAFIPPVAEMFVSGNSFPDEFRAEYRIKYGEPDETAPGNSGGASPSKSEARESFERLVNDGSNVAMGSLTFAPETDGKVGGVDWHTHPGPFLVAVTQGALTVTWEHDCAPRTYEAGESFVDLGQQIHKAENLAGEETVVYFSVIGVPEGGPMTTVVANEEGFQDPCPH